LTVPHGWGIINLLKQTTGTKTMSELIINSKLTVNEIAVANIKNAYMTTFPLSFISVSKGFLGSAELYIKGYIQTTGEWSNNISNNDPLNFIATYNPITKVYKEENLSLTIKATNPHMAYGSVKLRKKTIKNATPEKLANRFVQIRSFIQDNLNYMVHDITDKV